MDYELIFNIFSIVGYVAAAVLFFIGLKVMISYVKTEGDVAQAHKKKSITILAIACGAFAIGKTCANFIPMSNQDYNLFEIILQSAAEAVVKTGFLVLLPVVIKGKRNRGNSN
ncbi:MAG: hypothetical protein K5751_12150 [Treponemataceae bacterium]|jgi:hypothetical protein|nr:hypothetical protein [Treponemataceae bacterium]